MRVEAQGLTRRFGRVCALDGLDFELPPGRRVALVGPNGSGKSTLNRILMGLLAYEGRVRLDGVSPLADRLDVARRIAYVPQRPPALAAPVREVVQALGPLRGAAVSDVTDVAARLGLDLEAVAARPVRGLSGGMKQKLALALALAAPARLLILDEPTGSLDARTREIFFPLFEERARDATVLLCSHRLEEVRQLVDHVLLLHEGRKAWDGPAAGFLDASTTSVLEVRVKDPAAGARLAEQGFRRTSGAWWMQTVTQAQKLRLLPELAAELGGSLADLNVRDLEALEPEAARANGEADDG